MLGNRARRRCQRCRLTIHRSCRLRLGKDLGRSSLSLCHHIYHCVSENVIIASSERIVTHMSIGLSSFTVQAETARTPK